MIVASGDRAPLEHSLDNYDVKWRNFKLTWEREQRSDKFYHLCQNSGAVTSLQLKTKFLLLSNWAPWNSRKKECKDAKSTFQRFSHPVLMDVALVYRHDNFSRNDFALKVDALCDMDARTFFCSIFALQVFEQASKTCNAKTRIPLMLFCVTSVVNFPGKDFS